MSTKSSQVIVIGSGAGGAVTALELARAGFDVLVLEEGARHELSDYGQKATTAIQSLYRRRAMMPILGTVPIGYAEGQCVGGSTEINSGFWHRAPRETLLRWKLQYDLSEAGEEDLESHYTWAEEMLGVGNHPPELPASSRVFAKGVEAMGWSHYAVPRTAPGCRNTNTCAQGCPTGAKQGMSRKILPLAESFGARILPSCRVLLLMKTGKKITGILARQTTPDGLEHLIRLSADAVFVCCGPTETPALLQRSGIGYHVGNTLQIHPYLKIAARFKDPIDAHESVMPLLQVKEFAPQLTLGGSYFSAGYLALTLSENWPENMHEMESYRRMAHFYIGVQGTGKGSVKPTWFGHDSAILRYELTTSDVNNLSTGLAKAAALLLAGGAEAVFPSVYGIPAIRTEKEAVRFLDEPLSKSTLSLFTVHAFSSCPIGERIDRCAADSFGKVYGYENLYINDASMLPDSPGVNPQGTIMAVARRNALAFDRQSIS